MFVKGIPGIKSSLLEEFGVRLITYDLPGFGESDPHPSRDLNSSAMDVQHLADALGVNQKFWVFGYSSATMHAWATIKYISGRVAGMDFIFGYLVVQARVVCKGISNGCYPTAT